ncbi:GNAT family N-acetyltransferase [Streptomyces aidingensis]|uniref:Ribosomal protein S18 acetylase RimI n=1 Tax=Streptomyces aidingensis TaxID=910347 RepID=A0A1I1RNB2_9ACTN|nr:GNAT family N-acetyltransferase [Streptomyces aidingensis]SFD35497.1 Ribosomal protein S18 acetylase RimI [Streptomyces aidingensis]
MLTLRPTSPDDLPLLAALEMGPDTAVWLSETGVEWHRRALDDPDQEHLTAEEDGTPAGFCVLAGLRDGGGAVEVRRLVLRPALRGEGRGRELLRASVARAYREHRAQRVWLDVKPHNLRARTLYESEDFEHTETVPGAMVETDGSPCDLLIMTHRRP